VPVWYICPSADPMSPEIKVNTYNLEDLSKGNYAANWGKDDYMAFKDLSKAGTFGIVMLPGWQSLTQADNHPSGLGRWKMGLGLGNRFADITDGLSNTLCVSEVIGWDSAVDARGAWTSTAAGASIFMAFTGPNSTTNDKIPMCDQLIPASDIRHCTIDQVDGNVWAAARSRHPGGVMASMVDGSTKFYNDSIDLSVWRTLSTRCAADVPPQ